MKKISFVPEIKSYEDTRNVIKSILEDSNLELLRLKNQIDSLSQVVFNLPKSLESAIIGNEIDPSTVIGVSLNTANVVPKILRANVLVESDITDTGTLVSIDSDLTISGDASIDGTLDVITGYEINSVPGIDLTRSVGLGLNITNEITALKGTPGAGQSQFTAVASVSLTTESHTWTKGILTS